MGRLVLCGFRGKELEGVLGGIEEGGTMAPAVNIRARRFEVQSSLTEAESAGECLE